MSITKGFVGLTGLIPSSPTVIVTPSYTISFPLVGKLVIPKELLVPNVPSSGSDPDKLEVISLPIVKEELGTGLLIAKEYGSASGISWIPKLISSFIIVVTAIEFWSPSTNPSFPDEVPSLSPVYIHPVGRSCAGTEPPTKPSLIETETAYVEFSSKSKNSYDPSALIVWVAIIVSATGSYKFAYNVCPLGVAMLGPFTVASVSPFASLKTLPAIPAIWGFVGLFIPFESDNPNNFTSASPRLSTLNP